MSQAPESPDARPGEAPEAAEALVHLPMATPIDPTGCPCGRPPRLDGFCEHHVGAVAFRVPVTAEGEVLPAFGWQWGHGHPCPLGESWRIHTPSTGEGQGQHTWACPHRVH